MVLDGFLDLRIAETRATGCLGRIWNKISNNNNKKNKIK